jgi:hypothetical protein
MARAHATLLAALAAVCLSGPGRAEPDPVAPPVQPSAEAAALMAGAIDIHVHSYPDDRPRSIDALDVAKLAQQRGMRAIVLKNHNEPTAGIAAVVQKAVPGVQVFGGVALNRSVGGVNPAAVEHMAQLSGGAGKLVWMPTYDAENHVARNKESRPSIPVVRDGVLLPEVKAVIALIARHDLVLATGHSSPSEALLILSEAKRQGVRRMVATHPLFTPVFMTVEQMKQAAALGAYIEFAGGAPNGNGGAARMKAFAEVIRAIGVEHCILSTDLGQPRNPLPPDGMAELLLAMRAQGFSQKEVETMAKDNPARLLGLSP